MMNTLTRELFGRYLSHHEGTRSLLEWIGVIGAIAFPLLYLLRMNSHFPLMYDDLGWRAVATLLCLLLALRRWWPVAWQPGYLAFSYLTVFYCLGFLMPFSMMHNQATPPIVANMVLSVVLIILLTDWRNTIVMVAGGYALSIAAYWATAPVPSLPIDFIVWWLPVCGVLMACGGLTRHAEKRAELDRLRRYAGLAGSIAHEMRTPLGQIQHSLQLIDTEVPPNSDASRAVQQAHAAIQRGLQSISLTLQQISHRKQLPLELRTLSAAQCVRKALDEYAYAGPEERGHVHLQVDADFNFRGNSTAFELVLFNLLKNALYYLPLHPDMKVNVTVKTQPSTRIVVRDSGPGIPSDVLPGLFDDFQTHGKADGTGLGLSFCRRTLEGWGGGIECHSVQGQGTLFILNLPAVADEPVAFPLPASARATHRPLAGRTVLIVDDQFFNRNIARAMARELGLQTLQAEHGQQALDMLRDGPLPDVVLMDVNMPGLSGMDTTRRIRAMPGMAGRIPVLALTAHEAATSQASALEAGMQGVLCKPIRVAALQEALANALGIRCEEVPPSPTLQPRH